MEIVSISFLLSSKIKNNFCLLTDTACDLCANAICLGHFDLCVDWSNRFVRNQCHEYTLRVVPSCRTSCGNFAYYFVWPVDVFGLCTRSSVCRHSALAASDAHDAVSGSMSTDTEHSDPNFWESMRSTITYDVYSLSSMTICSLPVPVKMNTADCRKLRTQHLN